MTEGPTWLEPPKRREGAAGSKPSREQWWKSFEELKEEELGEKSALSSAASTKYPHDRDESKQEEKRSAPVGPISSVQEIGEGSCH